MSRHVHGVNLWTTRGELPHRRGRKRVQAELTAFRAGIVEELGGEDRLTAAQHVLIEATLRSYGVVLLADLYIREAGVFRPDRAAEGVLELQPVMGNSFLAYTNNIRLNLRALFPGGLSQRIEEGLTLAQVIQEKKGTMEETDGDQDSGEGEADRESVRSGVEEGGISDLAGDQGKISK